MYYDAWQNTARLDGTDWGQDTIMIVDDSCADEYSENRVINILCYSFLVVIVQFNIEFTTLY